jgi:hypothetical protein
MLGIRGCQPAKQLELPDELGKRTMSNPFQLIRKYQKVMLVVFGVMLMAIFGLGPVFDSLGKRGGGGSGQPKTRVKFNGGSITDYELAQFRVNHHRTQAFLGKIQELAGGMNVPFLLRIPSEQEAGPQQVDRMTLQIMMLAKRADQEGLLVGDTTVERFLAQAGGDKVDPRQLPSILKEIYGHNFSMVDLKKHLKKEIAALQMNNMLESGISAPLPMDNWLAFEKLNRHATCDAMSISIQEFADKITEEPSKAERNALFEEGRLLPPDPTHQKPGFLLPHKARFGYFVIDHSVIRDKLKNKISDEEVQAVYKKLAEEKDNLVIDRTAPDDSQPKSTDPATTDPNDTPDKTPDSDSTNKQSSDPAEPSTNSEEKGDADGKSAEKTETNEATKSTEDAAQPDATDKAAGCEPFQDDEQSEPAVNENQATEESQDKQATENKEENAPENKEEKTPSDTEPADQATPATAENTPENTPTENTPAENAPQQPTTTPPAQAEKPVKFKPLDERLADEIRESMIDATEFQDMLQIARDQCAKPVELHEQAILDWQVDLELDKKAVKPVPPEFSGVARANFATYGETPELLTHEEFSKHPIGSRFIQQNVLADYAFASFSDRGEYQVMIIEDDRSENRNGKEFYVPGTTYIVWYVEKVESHSPEFAECEPAIVKFWKYQKAIEDARAHAEKVAQEVRDSKQTLKAARPGETTSLGQFTWLTSTNMMMGPQISEIFPDLQFPGEKFMKTVFSLSPGEIGVAPDARNENMFVIQVIRMDDDEATLRETFFGEQSPFSASATASMIQNYALMNDINDHLMEEMGVKWLE